MPVVQPATSYEISKGFAQLTVTNSATKVGSFTLDFGDGITVTKQVYNGTPVTVPLHQNAATFDNTGSVPLTVATATQASSKASRGELIVVDRTSAEDLGQQPYSLTFVNNSNNPWTFLCFQQSPTGLPENYATLAWFAQPVSPSSQVVFTWDVDYNLVWSQTAALTPGVIFTASQTISADPANLNAIGFTQNPGGSFDFTPEGNPPVAFAQAPAGSLYINQDGTIPSNAASVGVGMSGYGTFAVEAQPNITTAFTPTPEYWVMFAQSVQQGEVMNITEYSSTAQILFPANVYSAVATLTETNTWSVTYPTAAASIIADLRRKLG